jgi:hypothetical protein
MWFTFGKKLNVLAKEALTNSRLVFVLLACCQVPTIVKNDL